MTEPEKRTAEQSVVEPSVSTAPARDGWRSRIPAHLGRARTSTVVLSVLFLAIFALYLNIRPETTGTVATTTSDTGTVQPVPTTTTPAPETTAEPTPTPTTTTPRTTSEPTTSAEPTTTEGPTETTERTTESSVPATSSVPEPSTAPTTVSPSG
jgi:cytoskeletal protein RodZ